MLLSLLLGACADDKSQRQFANDPQATEDLVGQVPEPAPTRLVPPTALAATPISAPQLLGITGGVETMFVRQGHEVLAVSLADGVAKTVYREKKGTVVALAPSPAADSIAILVRDEKTREVTLHLVAVTGDEKTVATIGSAENREVAAHGSDAVVWSPSGDRMLVSRKEGGVYEARADGTVKAILSPEQAPSPRALAWSPTGNAIAYVDAGRDGAATGLYVASIEALPLDPVTIIRPIEGRSRQIQEIAWVGGSVGIVYSERAADSDLSIGGDLFAVPTSGGAPRLLATAGGVAQVGAVGSFSVAPNLEAVAYSVLVPGKKEPLAGKLVVRQIDGTTSVPLPVPANGSVVGLAWSARGLVWAVAADGGLDINRVGAGGEAIAIATIGAAATPIASPVPAATPVNSGSPVPVSSPVSAASPAGEH